LKRTRRPSRRAQGGVHAGKERTVGGSEKGRGDSVLLYGGVER